MNVRDAFYQVLRAQGITTIFGNPGSNELPLLSDLPDDFRYILALQEGAAIGDDWDQDADASALGHLKSRVIDGNPVVPEEALGRLRERLTAAANPVMVAGPDIDTPAGWDGAVRLAEKLSLPVPVAPSPPGARSPPATPTTAASCPGASPPSPATSRGVTSSLPSAPRSSCTTSSPTATTCRRAPNCGQ